VSTADTDTTDDLPINGDGIATPKDHQAIDAGWCASGKGGIVFDEVVPCVGG
jgi:hypothetical protein